MNCGAKTRSGKPCKRGPVPGRKRCKLHGGASLAGPLSPSFKHGRHSKYMPKGMAERYEEALRDPNLTSLTAEIALTDLRVGDLLSAIGGTGNAKLWGEARKMLNDFKAGKTTAAAAGAVIRNLDALVDEGLTTATSWDELRDTLDLRRKLVETETRRMRDLHQLIDLRTAIAMMTQLVNEVTTRVSDPAVRAALSAHFARFVGSGSSQAARAGE